MSDLRTGNGIFARKSLAPFCSERCKLIDLGAWANDEYLIEGEPGSAMSLSEQDLDNAAQAALRRAEHIAEAEAKRSKRRR